MLRSSSTISTLGFTAFAPARQVDGEATSPDPARSSRRSSRHARDDAVGDRQAQTGAFADLFGGEERLEDVRDVVGSNAGSLVADFDGEIGGGGGAVWGLGSGGCFRVGLRASAGDLRSGRRRGRETRAECATFGGGWICGELGGRFYGRAAVDGDAAQSRRSASLASH